MEASTQNIVLCNVQLCLANLEPSGTVISFVLNTVVRVLEKVFILS